MVFHWAVDALLSLGNGISLGRGCSSFIVGWIFHWVDISLGGGCSSFIVGWIFQWGVDALLSLRDGYFIAGWIFHWGVDALLSLGNGISLGSGCSSFIRQWYFIGAWMLFFH